jgi:hypothetical protein
VISTYQILVRNPGGTRPLRKPGHRWGDYIKVNIIEIWWRFVDLIRVTLGRDQWRSLVSTVMNLCLYGRRWSSWVAERLLTPQEELSCLESVISSLTKQLFLSHSLRRICQICLFLTVSSSRSSSFNFSGFRNNNFCFQPETWKTRISDVLYYYLVSVKDWMNSFELL